MTSLMECYCTLLISCHHLGFLLQTADDTVYGIKEVLLCNLLAVVTGSYKSCFVTDIGDVSA